MPDTPEALAASRQPRRPRRRRGAGPASIRARLYNVGFGDCILLFIPYPEGDRTILVDCGAHMSGGAHPLPEVAADLVAAVTRDGRPRIDIVIMSHRHYDHISGFDQRIWDTVEVGEVWMPWTEERGAPAADALRRSQQRVAAMLHARFGASADTALGWLAINSFSNRNAEETLLSGFAGEPEHRYLPALERGERTFATPLLPGVTIHALGPSHDPEVIRDLDPPSGKYFPAPEGNADPALAATEAGASTSGGATRLFSDRFRLEAPEMASAFPGLAADADTAALKARAEADFLSTAAALEDAINGTSLVVALEFGGAVVLLAGDAEWGTWSEVLADPEWSDLLRRTRLYKVSHHGSYNGTPRPFVDDFLPRDATSIMSFKPVKRWPSIPRATLVDALESAERTLLRTDAMPEPSAAVTRNGDLWLEVAIPLAAPR